MEISKFLRHEDAAINEMNDITLRVERGELTLAEAEAKMVPILQGLERAKEALAAADRKRAIARSAGYQKANVLGGCVFMLLAALALLTSLVEGEAMFRIKTLEITGVWAGIFIFAFGFGGAFLVHSSLTKLRHMKNEPPNHSLKRTNQSLRD